MSIRQIAGKFLELLGMIALVAGLLAGMGLTPDGEPSMGKEMFLLGVGGVIFTLGWFVVGKQT